MRCMFFLATGLISNFSLTVQYLRLGLIERFAVSFMLPSVGLQPDEFLHSLKLLFEYKAFISMLQENELVL